MRRQLKGFIMGLIVAILLMNTAVGATVKKNIEVIYNSVNLTVNGKKVNADNILYNGTTYVPLRAIGEILGKEVGWNQATNTASINDRNVEVSQREDASVHTSRQNPAKINEKQTVIKTDYKGNLEYKLEITMTDLVSGQNALNILLDKDEYLITGVSKSGYLNDKKWTGDEEFVLAKFKVKVLETKENKSELFSTVSFNHVGKDNVFYNRVYSVNSPRNLEAFLYKDIYPNGEVEGWIVFKVNKNDDKVVTVFDKDRTSEAWFDLRSN